MPFVPSPGAKKPAAALGQNLGKLVLLQELLHAVVPLPLRASPSQLHRLRNRKRAKTQSINIDFALNIYYSNELQCSSFIALC